MPQDTRIPSRRTVLAAGGVTALTACSGSTGPSPAPSPTSSSGRLAAPTPRPLPSEQALPAGVFSLGVASGEPLPDGVVLWTRLAPEPLAGGGLGERTVDVEWQVATDDSFREVVASGTEPAAPAFAHSVHVEVAGLLPDRPYAYRFRAGRQVSPTGRTRTAPAVDGHPARVRFAFASCQDWSAGYYTAHRALAAEPDLSFVLFLGDYVYEGAASSQTLRRHEGSGEPVSLADYRNRHAQYKTDPALQAMHAAHPFIASVDDHEVDNDWRGPLPADPEVQSAAQFRARRAAALRAWWEHLPLRRTALPQGPDALLHRRFSYADLLQLDVLDTRQHRAPGTMLGGAQERWLSDGLRASRAQWNVLGSQVMVAREGDRTAAADDWDGLPAARARLLQSLAPVRNPVVVSGDRHATWACDLVQRFGDPGARALGAEITTTSLSSGGDQSVAAFRRAQDPRAEPHWRYWDARRGYVVCDADRSRLRAELRVVSSVTTRSASASTGAVFSVRDRVRGLQVDRGR